MRVLVTGSSGFIGKKLCAFLQAHGMKVCRLLRKSNAPQLKEEIYWDIEKQEIDRDKLEGLEAIIHLAGENIGEGRWTAQKKEKIFNSRVEGTKLLAHAVAQLKKPPRVFISASAVGYYGDRGDLYCSESTPQGAGFLASVCAEWEKALFPLIEKRIRTAIMRNGIVLSPEGGVLKKLLLPFSLGLGGRLGTGKQYMSWIALKDLLEAVLFILQKEEIRGPLNMVSPHPVTNAEFTHLLAQALKRPALLPVPEFLLRAVLGRERADELLLSSIRALPNRLAAEGFQFRCPLLKL